MLRGGSLMAGISIKGPLFGISNLKARRYATDAIDHGAEESTGRNGHCRTLQLLVLDDPQIQDLTRTIRSPP
jgi:hypothetical protein